MKFNRPACPQRWRMSFTLALSIALIALLTQKAWCLIPQRVILSTDANPLYIQFWPLVAKAWKDLIGVNPTLALVADDSVQVDENAGDVIRFKPLPGIPTSFYAQVVRLLLPTIYPNEVCILSDIDMLPLSRIYFLNLVKRIPDNNFVVYNDKAYESKYRQYPICYNAAKGSVFREIFGVKSLRGIPDKVREWHAFRIGWTSDEIILYNLLRQWKGYPHRLSLLGYQAGNQRIDRSNWHFNPVLLKSGYYIDSHMLRPYAAYREKIDALVAQAYALLPRANRSET
jgi:hypothetical protein